VGLTPKLFCRVQRWRQVLYLLAGKEQVDWMDVALTEILQHSQQDLKNRIFQRGIKVFRLQQSQ
jgi:hypothetical protein